MNVCGFCWHTKSKDNGFKTWIVKGGSRKPESELRGRNNILWQKRDREKEEEDSCPCNPGGIRLGA